jgi:hypothetical protein
MSYENFKISKYRAGLSDEKRDANRNLGIEKSRHHNAIKRR